ncbi:hypothetical protein K378_02853 [Streptomyces sp. Amel2xB2]|uniref:hypothetical protein n=1 Tax=Streptomyces sp. Amel2xB2 TaxID=1305829 RepID=UPI000DBF5773|nr:hypothetical protein [Streptomyces sp. Amel2xB2]RAJ66681.1 hypothetical protein K378_02853 [Streptomyces sp. Amel2xB2]
MTEGFASTHNDAHDSFVGVQASDIHNSTINIVPPDASPQQKYEVGVRCLEEGLPGRARELIWDAITHNYDGPEVRFHWVLAMLSKRAHHDLSAEERRQLDRTRDVVQRYAGDAVWIPGLQVVFDLLALPGKADSETAAVLKRLRDLAPIQRDLIVHHLDFVLTSRTRATLWAEICELANAGQYSGDRSQRVRYYFEPDPIGARTRPPEQCTAFRYRPRLAAWTGLFVVAAGFLGISAVIAEPLTAIGELVVALGTGFLATRFGQRWWHNEHRLQAKEQELRQEPDQDPARPPSSSPASADGGTPAVDGFTGRVRKSFERYFSNYAPRGFDRSEWLAHTAGIRAVLAAEVAFLYRESRISVERVNWLIRYLARDARDRHNDGTLFAHRQQYRTPVTTKLACVLALAVLGVISLAVTATATTGSTNGLQALSVFTAFFGAVESGRRAASVWLGMRSEEQRFAEETQEYHRRMYAREMEFQRWQERLEAIRPSDAEMEAWLSHDKVLFTADVLRHYQLTWYDIIAHTILTTPAGSYRRARRRGGPWRYSRYTLRLFLATRDGIREISTEVDFTHATRPGEQRTNYRFDALSSVQVTENDRVGYEMALLLSNGPARTIRIKDADSHQLEPCENARELSEINLDAAGFAHTFRLLEGIAADGKSWIERNNADSPPPAGSTD